MNRRTYLATLSAAAVGMVAGCGSGETGAGDQQPETVTETATPTQTPMPTQTSTPEPVVDASVRESELVTEETEHRTVAFATGEIENGDVPLLSLTVLAKFYDADGALLNSGYVQAMGVLSNEVWAPWIRYGGDGADVSEIALSIDSTSQFSGESLSTGGNAFVIDSQRLEIPSDENAPPVFSGKVRKTSETTTPRVRIIGKFYDEDDRLLTTATDVVSDMAVGETWSFSTPVLMMPRSRADEISQYGGLLYYR